MRLEKLSQTFPTGKLFKNDDENNEKSFMSAVKPGKCNSVFVDIGDRLFHCSRFHFAIFRPVSNLRFVFEESTKD